jgi:hypothetical protein
MNRVTVRSYRIVDQVPEQAVERLLRCAPLAERTQCYTDPVKIKIGRDPGGTKRAERSNWRVYS